MNLVIAFVFGIALGSFLNVVIIRIDDWKSIITGRSQCPNCKTQLRWYDLIPVISYATLRGRCRYCAKPISFQYPIVEVVMGILVMLAYALVFNSPLSLLSQIFALTFLILALGCMVVIFFHDLEKMLIPDGISYGLIIFALLFAFIYYGTGNYLNIAYGALIGLVPIALLVYPSRGKWMGEGDVKVALGLGLLTGFPASIVFIVSGFLLGGVYGAIALASRHAKLKSSVPFAPFLILGALIALFWGVHIFNWYIGMSGVN
jgi:leader peptidase (prepilin peptidase)/N-methyltransferase